MIKRVQALDELEFDAAKSNECIYGKYKQLYVYVKLGVEEEYRENPTDDPKTQYKLFRRRTIEYSQTLEQCEQGIYPV
ncbi:hypothetical protein [Chroococcus sp. FPU101]|uniref:hypothetical protein n=1 Tax=Chroococcus sp. FPU101 TaxID=1974212 RepID=UPI001F5D2F73|nr:hypothetical protein [Chroococcus sp. FPU101]